MQFQKVTRHLKRGGETIINNTLEKLNILDIFVYGMKLCHWASSLKFETKNNYHNFLTMSLYTFFQIFYTGKIYGGTQLIKKHQKNKYIVMFSPEISSKEDGENYGQFCKYELIEFCPCVDNIENAYNKLTDMTN